jgi:hypothetical protein
MFVGDTREQRKFFAIRGRGGAFKKEEEHGRDGERGQEEEVDSS